MCSIGALAAISTGFQAVGQYQQGKAQSEFYEAQAQAAEQNAAIEARRGEQIADQYAQKQRQLTDRMRLARGQMNAASGAAGLMGGMGSGADLLASSEAAFERDTRNLLQNQRNDTWSSWVNQVNYKNQADAFRASAYNAKQQGRAGAIGTILSGAYSFYGGGSKGGDNGGAWYDQGTQNILNTGSSRANVTANGFDMTTGAFKPATQYDNLMNLTKKKQPSYLGLTAFERRF